jgi:hypothetical protein
MIGLGGSRYYPQISGGIDMRVSCDCTLLRGGLDKRVSCDCTQIGDGLDMGVSYD